MRAFEENKALRDQYRVLSLNTDRQGQVYVSTMESPDVSPRLCRLHPSCPLARICFAWVLQGSLSSGCIREMLGFPCNVSPVWGRWLFARQACSRSGFLLI